MVAASKRGAKVVGAAPYTDTDPHGQIDRVFAMAREFDADIDMHLDFFSTAERMDLDYVCEATERFALWRAGHGRARDDPLGDRAAAIRSHRRDDSPASVSR